MNQMIEKLARALLKARFRHMEWEDFKPETHEELRGEVIALLAALREPSEEMVEAGNSARDPRKTVLHNTQVTWTAMIDSILPKGGEG